MKTVKKATAVLLTLILVISVTTLSAYSAFAVVELERPLVTVSRVTTEEGANAVELRWDGEESADTYRIARMASYSTTYDYYEVNEPYYLDEDISEECSYRYQVQAIRTEENGEQSFSPWSYSKGLTFLPRPEFTLSNKSNGIRMEWQSYPNVSRYYVYIRKAEDANWQSFTTTNCYYPFLAAEAGSTYYFQLRYLQENNIYSNYSRVRSMTFLNKQKLTSVTSNDTAVILKWKEDKLADYYLIEKTTKGKAEPDIFTVAGKTTFTDKGTNLDTTYYYRVCTVRAETDSRRMGEYAYGLYSEAIRINPRAFKTVKIAESQINSGGLKYCKEMGNLNYVVPWCVFFCGWCMKQSGYNTAAYGFPPSGNVGVWSDNLKKMNRFEVKENYTPVQGDLIVFGYGPYNRVHIGLVYRVVDGYVYSIEGNTTSGKGTVVKGTYNGTSTVLMKCRKLNDSYIYGYGRIPN